MYIQRIPPCRSRREKLRSNRNYVNGKSIDASRKAARELAAARLKHRALKHETISNQSRYLAAPQMSPERACARARALCALANAYCINCFVVDRVINY